MDRPFKGWDKQYEKNYDRIFRKSIHIKIKEFIDKFLFKLFIQ